jgi:hypothetical protein
VCSSSAAHGRRRGEKEVEGGEVKNEIKQQRSEPFITNNEVSGYVIDGD